SSPLVAAAQRNEGWEVSAVTGRATAGAPADQGSDAPAFSLRNVSVQFGDPGTPRALKDVSIECRPGEFLVLVGRSGCGKTTILNLVSGLLDATEGDVEVLGTTPKAARSRLGYMFARDALLPWRTAERNVELGLEVLHADRKQRRQRALEML